MTFQKGYIPSEETKRKASEFIKERNRIFGNPMKNKYHTSETRRKMSLSHLEQIPWNKNLTKETDERVKRQAKNNTGKEVSEIQRQKQSETMKRLYEEGKLIHPMKGKHQSIESRKKSSESHKGIHAGNKNPMFGRIGKLSPTWQDGKSFEPYTKEFNKQFKLAIKQRDGFLCLKCGMRDEDSKALFKKGLAIHHIDSIKENTFKENCCVLCVRCNAEVNFNRNSWKTFFQSILTERNNYKYDENQNIIINVPNQLNLQGGYKNA